MSYLQRMLRQIPAVYEDLLDASTPGRRAEPSDRSPDPRDKPAPGNVGVMEHRHELVRELRRWCAATGATLGVETPMLGQSIERACAWLEVYAVDLPDDRRGALAATLSRWLNRAWSMLDQAPCEPGDVRIPPPAWEQEVTVATAAQVLGCTVRTIRRRVAPEDRPGGRLKLRAALGRCRACGKLCGLCDHTRCQRCGLILGQCEHASDA